MRIGIVAPPWVPVPPPVYGGTELVVANLARGLVALGHDVTVFTVGESTVAVRRAHLFARAVEPLGQTIPEAAHVLAAHESLRGMDLIHDHTTIGPLLVARSKVAHPPVVTTNHGPFTPTTRRIYTEIARSVPVVAISQDQARRAINVPIAAVIHHGIDLDMYRPGAPTSGSLLFVGRMSPDKGPHRAILIARKAGLPLCIVAKMRAPEEHEYFETMVRPLLGADIEIPQELSMDARLELLAGARALVNPIMWPEPFGLVMAESLASATPVIAFPNGAAPEIVTHRRTGFLCTTVGTAAAAVGHLDEVDRSDCRRDAERRFSIERMARDHERLYRAVFEDGPEAVARRRLATVVPPARKQTRAPIRQLLAYGSTTCSLACA